MTRTAQEIQEWTIVRVSQLTGVARAKIDPTRPLLRVGLDSFAAVALLSDLEAWLDYRFYGNPLDADTTIASLAEFVAAQLAQGDRPS